MVGPFFYLEFALGKFRYNFSFFSSKRLKADRYNPIMIPALNISTAGMIAASDRLEDIAAGIANPVADNAEQPATASSRQVRPEESVAPVSASPDLDPTRLVELIETEAAFNASALATKSVASASQELMDALS